MSRGRKSIDARLADLAAELDALASEIGESERLDLQDLTQTRTDLEAMRKKLERFAQAWRERGDALSDSADQADVAGVAIDSVLDELTAFEDAET